MAHGDYAGSQLMSKQLQSGMSLDVGSDGASYLSDVSLTASGNVAEPPGHPRPSRRSVPPEEGGTHQVTFTVSISVAFPFGKCFALLVFVVLVFSCFIVFIIFYFSYYINLFISFVVNHLHPCFVGVTLPVYLID